MAVVKSITCVDGIVTAASGGIVETADLADGAVTTHKMAEVSARRLLGRSSATPGAVQEIALSGDLQFVGGTLTVLYTGVAQWTSPPSSASDPGTPGDIAYDSLYLYICTDVNTWRRVALSTW